MSNEELRVTGVIENIPQNSHFQFDYAFPAINMTDWRESKLDSWEYSQFATYIEVGENTRLKDLSSKTSSMVKRYLPESKVEIKLQPLREIHLRSSHMNTWMVPYPNQGSITYVYIFSLIAVCILLIACINFMNLSTARSGTRAREVGMRKVAGASRKNLVAQFIGESLALTFLALLIALFLVELLLPAFNALAGKNISMDYLRNPGLIIGLAGIALVTGILSGSYPSLVLSSMKPVKVLKAANPLSSGKGGSLRKILVVVQFSLTIALITATAVIYLQLHFMRTKDLGFNKDHMLLFWTGHAKAEVLRETLKQNPNVLDITFSQSPTAALYGFAGFDWEGRNPEQDIKLYPVNVDYDYIKTFKIEMAEGRFFSRKFSTDALNSAVLNETAVKIMGLESPIGKRISYREQDRKIIGVIKDYHVTPLHNRIEPMILWIPEEYHHVCVRINPENVSGTLKFMQKAWLSLAARGYDFEYEFLDSRINGFYSSERKTGVVFRSFTLLAVFIACLGLFGLASFTAEQRTREIGIRKVLGASVSGIVLILSREFTRWVIIANVIAWPVAYFTMRKWLSGFAYRIDLGWEIFGFSALLALVIAIITVSYQSIKAATANPVESLRYE
jgi:putative ABC transport system permease protein